MPPKRNNCREDYERTIKHYQDLNNEIEQKVEISLSKLSNSKDSCEGKILKEEQEKPSFEISKKLENGSSPDAQAKPNGKTNKIIIQLSQRLRTAIIDFETVTLKNKQLVEESEEQKQELIKLKDNLKKIKSAMISKQLVQDAHKKEISEMAEKLKAEEETRKTLQKEIERLSKQSASFALQKEKIELQLDRTKTDLLLMKQNKVIEHMEGNKIHVMMKCIRKQAALIRNLDNQISCLEQMTSKSVLIEDTRT